MERPRTRGALLVPVVSALVIIGGLAAWWLAGGGDGRGSSADPGPVHVHALGINPADEALFVATHTGLYRVGDGEERARRVSDHRQDTMGFTVIGPDRFLGSGHPDLRDDLPPHLGLIESIDAGETWRSISLLGEADFHVLRLAGGRVYGYDSSNDRLLVSSDEGRAWKELERPGQLLDLAVDPRDSRHLVAAVASDLDQGLYESRDGGRNWSRLGREAALLSWPEDGDLIAVSTGGNVLAGKDGPGSLAQRGEVGGEPAALLAQNAAELYVALHDGTIKHSTDGGVTWAVRSTP